MFKIVSAREAIDTIPDGACVAINSFLGLSNPECLHNALTERFSETGSPTNLRLFCAAGFGCWDESRYAEPYVAAGAVSEVVAGHYGSMPATQKAALNNQIEAYCLPLGVLSHSIRAAAAGRDWLFSEVGIGIYADPRIDSCGMNERSSKKLLSVHQIAGKEYLMYPTPQVDVAFIKGTAVDPNGNISSEREYLELDALALAQATKRRGGKVIIQVEQVSHEFARPRNVIIPGILVDMVVVCEPDSLSESEYIPALSGDVHVPATHMDYYMSKLGGKLKPRARDDFSAEIIGERAARELRAGQIVNIGIGIPEMVGKYASKKGILKDIAITVEAGGIGGLPAPGVSFGATIGADMICDMATQFDLYDGGGLDICFLGGLEVDSHGNVNAHRIAHSYAGIGGFANITHATKTIVFCLTFTTKGLRAVTNGNCVQIKNEGSVTKFKKNITAISFAAKNAVARGQRVLYVTERCVFELTENGLRLKEVFPGIDGQKDIRDLLDFEVL
jgi:propionate CoA-transferase